MNSRTLVLVIPSLLAASALAADLSRDNGDDTISTTIARDAGTLRDVAVATLSGANSYGGGKTFENDTLEVSSMVDGGPSVRTFHACHLQEEHAGLSRQCP